MPKLMELVQQILAYYMKHNAEPAAVDLSIEVEALDLLVDHVDSTNYKRACSYLTSFLSYLPRIGDAVLLGVAYTIYMKFEDYANALRIALSLHDIEYVKQIFSLTEDLLLKKQFCYILARHGVVMCLDDEMDIDDDDRKELQEIINNVKLHEGYLALAHDIGVMEPKTPEEICKDHLIDGRANVTFARQNLAAVFVNAFVNAGFGQDKMMTFSSESPSGASSGCPFEYNEHGKTTAIASLGMIILWDIVSAAPHIVKYAFHDGYSDYNDAGYVLGLGIGFCGLKNDAFELMRYIHRDDMVSRIGAILGLGIAYAGSHEKEIKLHLTQIMSNSETPLDVLVFSAITLGLVYVGSCDDGIAKTIRCAIIDRSEAELDEPLTRLLPVALGLLYLGMQKYVPAEAVNKASNEKIWQYAKMQENFEATCEVVSKAFNEKIRIYADVTLMSMAYAGTGNVLMVQRLMSYCTDKGGIHQRPAVLGIALIAMADEVGIDMAIRSLVHLLQYGEQNARRAVPLALGVLCISNPKVNVIDILKGVRYDADADVSMAAIISLGLIGAGTNNGRIADMLLELSGYYHYEADPLLCVRIAQGLLHMGKGLLTLSPYHSERFLLSLTSLAGLITVVFACLDLEYIIMGEYPYMLYILVLAMQPRMLMTVDENLKPLSVPVRVGKAVDVVGKAGCPKTITGFQTYTTPVLIAAGERAELATEKYIPLTPILEGFVILKETN